MRILTVTSLYPSPALPDNGLFNRHLLELVGRRHDVTVLAPVFWTALHRGTFRSSLPGAEKNVVRPVYVYPPGVLRELHGWFFHRSIRRTAEKLRERGSFDLVFGMFAYPDGWAASRLATDWKVPFLLRVHGSDVHQLRHDPARSGRVAEALRRADAVIPVSEALADEVRTFTSHPNVRVVRNGVDTGLFSPGRKEEARRRLGLAASRPVVLYVGRLERVKGADLLPAIAALLPPEVVWALIGSGSLAADLRPAFPGRTVIRRPRVPHDALPDWYRAADLLLIPSRAEGIPNALREALACDRPVVAARVGGIPEVLPDGGAGRLVPAGDPAGFASAVRELLDRPPAPGEARAVAEPHTWEASAAALEVLLTEVRR